MSRSVLIGMALPAILAVIFVAGFFHGGPEPASARTVAKVPAEAPAMKREIEEASRDFISDKTARDPVFAEASKLARKPAISGRVGSFLSLTTGPGYRRAAQMSLKVEDCAKAEEGLETKLEELKGEILEMVMEGTEGSRTCMLSVLVPSDHFREFISHLRGMGTVQSERITASRLTPGRNEPPPANGHDVRELSHVNLRMADEKVAQNVLESRGVLAASFDESASHFMKGAAVMVEGVGYVLPFFLALLVMAIPLVIAMRLRRVRTVRIHE